MDDRTGHGGRARALIAEDETLIRLDLSALLERAGFAVCAAARDGEEAVELARTAEPDFAILDVRMPRLDGIEAARRILAERPIPIVLLTAFSDRTVVDRAVAAGVTAYLVKPFREEDLLPAILDRDRPARRADRRAPPDRLAAAEADRPRGADARREPLAAPPRAAARRLAVRLRLRGGLVRILIAEDETMIRLDLRTLLEGAGFEVCAEVADGEEAVERARAVAPDLAILDVKMPRTDGIEAARRIIAERPIPIVIVSAHGEEELVRRAVEAGVFGYLTKPFREADLAPAIRTAIARHETWRRSARRPTPSPRPRPRGRRSSGRRGC